MAELLFGKGSLEIICGCMFSGKTRELIRRMELATGEGYATVAFKPAMDSRYHTLHIVSHDGSRLPGIPVAKSGDIPDHINNNEIIGIDEAQFFDNGIMDVCKDLLSQNRKIIIAGLDMDYSGKPFGPMAGLMAMAGKITVLNAVCAACGDKAAYSFRKIHSDSIIQLGEADIYEARCYACYLNGMSRQSIQE